MRHSFFSASRPLVFAHRGGAEIIEDGACQIEAVFLQLDDDQCLRVPGEDGGQRRNTRACQLVHIAVAHRAAQRRRSIERPIVVHDHGAIAR